MENIKAILARSQPGHSLVLNKATVCSCGKEIETYSRVYGKCHSCQRKERDEALRKEVKAKLPEVIENQKDLWQEDCNYPSYFCFKTFEDFDRKIQPKAFDTLKNYSYHFNEKTDMPAHSIVLLSPGIYGVGKTHLVCALINKIIDTEEKAYISDSSQIIKRKCPVYFTTENELLRRIRATYDHKEDGESESDVYRKLSRFDLLIIDDVGKVRPRDLSFLQGVYFTIIDERYTESLSMILTTNLDYSELESHIGGACADRLREMAGSNFIKMIGTSYRQKAK